MLKLANIAKTKVDPQSQRSAFFGALRTLLQALAQNRRLVLVIDDLQWADPGTLSLLTFLVAQPELANR